MDTDNVRETFGGGPNDKPIAGADETDASQSGVVAFPNPFNPTTMLRYELPEYSFVTLTIYDMLGKEITTLVNDRQEPGYKSVRWDATDSMGKPVSAGVYLYQIHAGEFVQTKKMVLLK